jgi:hypothetical protein
MDMKRLGTWERKILRRIYEIVEEQGTWKIITNLELRELYKHLDILADIYIYIYIYKKIGMDWTCSKNVRMN